MTLARQRDSWWIKRATGIDTLGEVLWGTHVCHFFQKEQDLVEVLVPYICAGLSGNEYCMWVTCDPLGVEKAKSALTNALGEIDQYLISGQLEILDCSDWYSPDGHFDAQRTLAGWLEKLVIARQRGFGGLRLSANTIWLKKHNWQAFAEYESLVDDFISQHAILAICSYSLDMCEACEILDVMANHNYALVQRDGAWQVIESTERKRSQELLRQSEERFAAAFHTTNTGFGLISVSGGIVIDANQAWLDMLGLTGDELVGKSIYELKWFADLIQLEKICARIQNSLAISIPEVPFVRKDGESRVYSLFIRNITLHGERCYLITAQDVTDFIQTRAGLEAALTTEKRMASERDQSRVQLVRFLAHEIRNPLTALKGFAQVIGVQTSNDQVREVTAKMIGEVDRLCDMLSDVLNAFRLQLGTLPMDFQILDFADLVESAVQFHSVIGTHFFELTIERPVMIKGDASRLGDLLRNLLSNAEKYSPLGSVIQVGLAVNGDHALLSVRDHGVGIPPQEVDRIFEGFFRASNIGLDGPSGTGVGLHLCKYMVERHNGQIWAESQVGEGSTFYVKLPLSTLQ